MSKRLFLRARSVFALAVALLAAACSTTHYPVNPPLARIDTSSGYRAPRIFAASPPDHFFLHVSMSGGGSRAASLGFGVLEALRETPLRWEGRDMRLIDQMDVLLGVSGGSILAGAYALHGADGLERFERSFLQTTLQQDLVSLLFSPRNLWRVQSQRFGRGDLLAEYLDERLFQGATFGDLSRALRKPYVILHASDMGTGARFEFTQDQFDFLCSDLDAVPLARAVAASSAAPLVLSPLTFWNHAPRIGETGCGEPPMRALARELPPGGHGAEHMAELETFREVRSDGLLRPYVHLLDGGLADNVGARGTLDYFEQFGSVIKASKAAGYRQVRRVVFLVVNAETSARPPEDRSADVPGPLRTALALADIPINRNSTVAMSQKRAMLDRWQAEVREVHARGDYDTFAPDVRFYLIEVRLGDEPDAALREKLLAIPTTLELPAADVALLRRHGASALRRSPDFQRLLSEMPP